MNRPVADLPLSEDAEEAYRAGQAYPVGESNGNGRAGSARSVHPAGRAVSTLNDAVAHFQQDAPTCPNCGHVAVRNGACYKCLNCGESLGCS
jgi:ribonucleoside-diphosphate reductase alpha chain